MAHSESPAEGMADAITRRAGDINDREFRIVVPKFDNDGRKIKTSLIENIATRISERFGGVTVHPSTLGCWKPDDGDLMCEENILFTTVRDSADNVPIAEDQAWFRKLAHDVGSDFGQFSVMVAEDIVETEFITGEFEERLGEEKVGRDVFKELV